MSDTEEQMARDLIDHIKRTHTPRLALLEDRQAAVLEYMDQVEQGEPTRVALSHVRAFLSGGRDSILAAFLPDRTEPPSTEVGKRVKSMPDRKRRGFIDSLNRDALRITVTITWDDGSTTVERYGDLGVTWAYVPDTAETEAMGAAVTLPNPPACPPIA